MQSQKQKVAVLEHRGLLGSPLNDKASTEILMDNIWWVSAGATIAFYPIDMCYTYLSRPVSISVDQCR